MSQPFYRRASFAYFVGGFLLFVIGLLILLITFQPIIGGGFGLGWGGGFMFAGFQFRRLEKQLEEKTNKTNESLTQPQH